MASANEMEWSRSSRAAARKIKFQERVDQLDQTLFELRSDMELRQYMLTLVRNQGAHCRTCGSVHKAKLCDPTCPLLRPGGQRGGIAVAATETWRKESLDTLRRYKTITDDLRHHGYNVSVSELQQWETKAADMQWREVDKLAKWQSPSAIPVGVKFAEIDWHAGATQDQWGLHSPTSSQS